MGKTGARLSDVPARQQKEPCSSTKISLTDMAPAARPSAELQSGRQRRCVRETTGAFSCNDPPLPPLPLRPPGPTLSLSLGSFQARGARMPGCRRVRDAGRKAKHDGQNS